MEEYHLVRVVGAQLSPLYKGVDDRPRNLTFRMLAQDQEEATNKVLYVLQLEDIPYESIGGSSIFNRP